MFADIDAGGLRRIEDVDQVHQEQLVAQGVDVRDTLTGVADEADALIA